MAGNWDCLRDRDDNSNLTVTLGNACVCMRVFDISLIRALRYNMSINQCQVPPLNFQDPCTLKRMLVHFVE